MPFDLTGEQFPMRDITAQAKIACVPLTGPDDYVDGGETVTLADLGLSEVWWFSPFLGYSAGLGGLYSAVYDAATGKLVWYVISSGAQVAAGVDLSDIEGSIFVTGK